MIVINSIEWDEGNWPKCGKHGVSKDEIEDLFLKSSFVVRDPFPFEDRYKAIGKTKSGRYLICVFTVRKEFIRPISARYMHKKESDHYERLQEK